MSETSKTIELGTIFHDVCEDPFLGALSEDNRVKVALSLFIQANDKRGVWPRKGGNGAAPAQAQGEQSYTGAFVGRKAEDYQKKDGTATKRYTFKVGDKEFVMYGAFGQKVAESTREFKKNDRVTASYDVNGKFTNLKSLTKANGESTDDLEQQSDDIPF